MGIMDSLKKGLKAIAEKTGQALDNFAKNQRFRSVVSKLKLELLTRFTKDQLEKIAALENISLYTERPVDPMDPFAGFKQVRLTTKVDIAKRLASHLTFNEVVEYARKFKVPYKDLEEQREKAYMEIFGVGRKEVTMERLEQAEEECVTEESNVPTKSATSEATQDKLLEVASALHSELGTFLRPVRDESELKAQLYSFLVGRFGIDNVREEFPLYGRKVDIVVFDDIAIELKIARNTSSMNNLLGEVLKLKNAGIHKVIALILDTGKYPNLNQDVAQLKQLGAFPVVVRGTLKPPKSKKVEVRFK